METTQTVAAVEHTPKAGQKGAGKFFYTLMMLVVEAAIIIGALVAFFNAKATGVLAIGALVLIVYAAICFFVKKGSRPLLVWWGIIALATAGWWIYLLTKSS